MYREEKPVWSYVDIDFTNFNKKEDGKYVYQPPDVIPLEQKALILNWDEDSIEKVESWLTLYRDLPIVCKGEECPFASTCPLVKNKIVSRWVGHGCPIEVVDIFKCFSGYVNDLSIAYSDYTDLQVVNDLARLQVLMSRCDKLIRMESPVETLVTGVDSKTDLKHEVRQPNQLVELQMRLRKDVIANYKLLVASRQDKINAEAKRKIKKDVSTQMADILDASKKSSTGVIRKLEID